MYRRAMCCLLGLMGAMALLAVPARASEVDIPASLDCNVYARHDDENDCDDELLEAGVEGSDSIWHYGALLRFSGVGQALPACADVQSATLNLYGRVNSGGTFAAYRMIDGFSAGVTWGTYNGTNAWPSNGLDFPGDSFASDPDDSAELEDELADSWHVFDVTGMTTAWVTQSEPNQGVFVRADPTTSLGDATFASSEAEELTPYLHVEYTLSSC
jgi:hypothetical protein